MSEAENGPEKLHDRKGYLEGKYRTGFGLPAFSVTPRFDEAKRKAGLDTLC